jgi:hypothetical protein
MYVVVGGEQCCRGGVVVVGAPDETRHALSVLYVVVCNHNDNAVLLHGLTDGVQAELQKQVVDAVDHRRNMPFFEKQENQNL